MPLAAKVNPLEGQSPESVNGVDRAQKRAALRDAIRLAGTKQEAIAAERGQDAGYFCRLLDRMVETLDALPDEVEQKFHELCLALGNKVVVDRNDLAQAMSEIQRAHANALALTHGRLDLLPSPGAHATVKVKP